MLDNGRVMAAQGDADSVNAPDRVIAQSLVMQILVYSFDKSVVLVGSDGGKCRIGIAAMAGLDFDKNDYAAFLRDDIYLAKSR